MSKHLELSENFTLNELIKSQTAERNNIDNTPTDDHISSLEQLCSNILQPVRDEFGAVIVSSGYRCAELCEKIGSSANSQHAKGQAADFECNRQDNLFVAKWIEANLNFDQLILECYKEGDPNSGWIHCSFVSADENRNQSLTYDGKSYAEGLPE